VSSEHLDPLDADDTVEACRQKFRNFARHSARTAPLYAELADGIAADDELAALLLHAPPEQRQPVLLFACVHWLVLAEPDSALARYYPNLHAASHLSPPAGPAIDALREWTRSHRDELTALLATRRTQTNEVGRAALLLPALALAEAEAGPLAHVDVGASAGLNLLLPHYRYRYEPGGDVGGDSRVVVRCSTRGTPPPLPSRPPTVAAALGLDAAPVDVADPDQARWLEACVWPDQVERFERLAAAIEVANDVGVDVRQGDAVGDVAAVVAAAVDAAGGAAHPVVTTSWMLNYLSSDRRQAFVAALDDVGAERDLSWVYAENPALCPELPGVPAWRNGPDEPTSLVLVRWRRGRRDTAYLADAHPHGTWLRWVRPERP